MEKETNIIKLEHKDGAVLLNGKKYHLYFTNDDEIKEGDWMYCSMYPKDISKANKDYEGNLTHLHKIIAATDEALKVKTVLTAKQGFAPLRKDIIIEDSLPQPSQSFIKKYCELGGIDEVIVEYEFSPHEITQDDFCITCDSNGCKFYEEEKYKLKTDSHNTITIKSIKDSWTKEEVQDCVDIKNNEL